MRHPIYHLLYNHLGEPVIVTIGENRTSYLVYAIYMDDFSNIYQSSFCRSDACTSFTDTLDGARDVIRECVILASVVLTAWKEKSNSPTNPRTCLETGILEFYLTGG